MTAIDLSKQKALDAAPKAMQQISFTRNSIRQNAKGQIINDNTTMFFINVFIMFFLMNIKRMTK